jgi:serine/threonine protein kinase/tetratricopeptide (TPR) repeat protein
MKCPHCETQNQEDSQFCINCATPFTLSDDTLAADHETIFFPKRQFKPEKIFAGRYEIVEELGKGGMGVVYKAKDNKLKRFVALKFLPSSLSSHQDAKLRFIQEAQTASILDHQNICTIHEIDETEDGQMYIAMAYYEGETLKNKIIGGAIPLAEAIEIVIQIAQGLSKAHSEGIVHRDIKPANIIETSDRVIKIVDFGLAKLASEARPSLTSSIIGTPAYMSPEQATGESLDQRIDLWSLGVVFYELLTGHIPFQGENEQSMLHALINKTPESPISLKKDIPVEAERIVLKCLRKQPERRYQSADRLISDLTKLKISLEKKKEDLAAKKRMEAGRESERRQATVLSGEILGYSEVLESLDTEDAAFVINRCFAMLDSIIGKYESRIDEITGGSFMASFGIPLAIEDAPKKAINAAIELRNSMDTFNKKENLNIPLDVRIGVNSGTVVAGVGSTDKVYSVIGEDVNLASQLRDISTKNNIYVGPLTFRYTKNDFEFEKLESISLKGRTEPITVFKLLSVKEKVHRARLGAERMIYSDMVGRENELDKLKLHVLKTINGEGSIVNIIGEAGIGKSRLVAELNRIDEMKKVILMRGRALSIGSNLSFHPVIDILKSWARIKEEDPPAVSAQKIEKVIRNVFPEEVSEIFPFIATLMGIKLTGKHAERIKGIEGEALEKLILKNFRDLIARASIIKPLVFVLEDLHWADSTSVDLFESLFRLSESKSILFINVMRPDYETSERILRTIRNRYPDFSTEIHLEPLDDSLCEVLIGNLLNVEALPIRIRELIARRAEGNPFFIEEVARSFIDDGVVEIENGRFRVTEKIDSVVIPETINDVIMARVDKLDEQTKSLLRIASVIGRNFFYKILADVASGVEEIDDTLEHLKEVQLIKERRRMKELEYLFKHALAWDAVYNSILLKKRKKLHLDVARSIESVFTERLQEFYGMLALHYTRGENFEKSEEYLIKAGEDALKTAASNEALSYFQEALNLYLKKHGDAGDPGKISSLEKSIAMALYNKGHYTEALNYFDNVIAYLGVKRPKNKFISVINLLSNLSNVLLNLYIPRKKKKIIPTAKDNEVADLIYKRGTALSSLDTTRFFMDSIGLIRRFNKLDFSKIENGATHYAASSALFSVSGVSFPISKKILDYSSRFIDKRDKKSTFLINAYELMHDYLSGNWDRYLEYDRNTIDYMLKAGDIFMPRIQLVWSGLIKLEQGYFNDANIFVEKLNEIGEEYEHDGAISSKYSLNAILLLKKRELNTALDEVNKGIDVQKSMYKNHHLLEMLAVKMNILIILKDIDAAANSLRKAKDLISQERHITPYYMAHFLLSQFILDLVLFEETIKSNEESKISKLRKKTNKSGKAAIKNAKKYAANKTEVFRYRGVYYWLVGKQKKAIGWWRKSINIGKELKALPELARTYMEIGKRLMEKKSKFNEMDGKEYKWYLNESEKIFKKLDLEWDIEEFSKLRSFGEDK